MARHSAQWTAGIRRCFLAYRLAWLRVPTAQHEFHPCYQQVMHAVGLPIQGESK
jgi:hypothetical protein